MNLIDREELRERSMPAREFMRNNPDLHVVSLNQINRMPIIDAEPVRHAAWQYEISFEDESKRDDFDVTCTGCGALFGAETRDDAEIIIMGRWDYCPNCGAKMDLEVQDDG